MQANKHSIRELHYCLLDHTFLFLSFKDYLNDRMREKGLQRIRYAMKPDEAFGLIYSWDNVLVNISTFCKGLIMVQYCV